MRWGRDKTRVYLKSAAAKRPNSDGIPKEPLEINVNTTMISFYLVILRTLKKTTFFHFPLNFQGALSSVLFYPQNHEDSIRVFVTAATLQIRGLKTGKAGSPARGHEARWGQWSTSPWVFFLSEKKKKFNLSYIPPQKCRRFSLMRELVWFGRWLIPRGRVVKRDPSHLLPWVTTPLGRALTFSVSHFLL